MDFFYKYCSCLQVNNGIKTKTKLNLNSAQQKRSVDFEHLSKLAEPKIIRKKYNPSQASVRPPPLIDSNVGTYIKEYKRAKRFDKIKSKGIKKLSQPRHVKSSSRINPYAVSKKALNYKATPHILSLCQPKHFYAR